MGVPMASRLAKNGYPLFAFNRTPKPWSGEGSVTLCKTPSEVARMARIVFVMVTDGEASHHIFMGKGGLLESDLTGRIMINMTTERPEEACQEAIAVQKQGGRYLDMPVSGSVVPAQNGALLLLAGGDASLQPILDPFLKILGSGIKWMGPVGSGMKAKLVLNALLAAHMRDLAESVLLAESLGLSREQMAEVILESPLATPFYRIKTRNILEGDFTKAFSVALMAKDLLLLSMEATSMGFPLAPVFSDLLDIYRNLNASGHGEMDLSVIYEVLQQRNQASSGSRPGE